MTTALPEVTVVAIDCVAHDLTRMALDDTLRVINPAEVVVFSNKRSMAPEGALFVASELNSLDAVAKTLWCEAHKYVKTSHMLVVQWDGWPVDEEAWTDEWLKLDYVGAPWWHNDQANVGNGGFSLRSTDLMRYLANHQDRLLVASPEDDLLCRKYRQWLEICGFEWASEESARRFSFERKAPMCRTFGFHGSFNWPRVLSESQLRKRYEVARTVPYVMRKSDFSPRLPQERVLHAV